MRGISSEKLLEQLGQNGEANFSCVMGEVERSRDNALRQRVSVSTTMRFASFGLPNSRYGHHG
ncbi:MAG: hypothetical protein M3N45_03375 [Actinomycetota bacterium]|nr:hypothetical protein [Actinomycetota bacterium]